MAAKRGIKRRRSPSQEQDNLNDAPFDRTPTPDPQVEDDAPQEEESGTTPQSSANEQEIWNAFREENYEGTLIRLVYQYCLPISYSIGTAPTLITTFFLAHFGT